MTSTVAIHRTAYVAPGVTIGARSVVGPGAVILGPCEIGADCWIGPGAVIGTTAEHVEAMVVQLVPDGIDADDHEAVEAALWNAPQGGGVVIGDGTIVREQSAIHQGTVRPTRIGARAFIMNKTYVAHDCTLGDDVRLGPGAALAGNVWVGRAANIGMAATVHQHRRIGAGAMIGMNATVTRDIAPFVLAYGTPARAERVNRVLLERLGHPEEVAATLEAHLAGDGPAPASLESDFTAYAAATDR